jgi:hypothetical protein
MMLGRVSSLQTLSLVVEKKTTLSALSAIFCSSAIKNLCISIRGTVATTTLEGKLDLSHLVKANTILKKLTLNGSVSTVLHILATSALSLTDLKVNCDELSIEDGRNLSIVPTLETVNLYVSKQVTMSAVSAIFCSSTIKDLNLSFRCPVIDIVDEHKMELGHLDTTNSSLKKLTLEGTQHYVSGVLHISATRIQSLTNLKVKCSELSVEDGWNLGSMASLENLNFTMDGQTSLSAVSAIFCSATIEDMLLWAHCPVTGITEEHKLEMSHVVSANTSLKKLDLCGPQGYMSAVLQILATSAQSLTNLVIRCTELSVEDGRNLSNMKSLETLHFIARKKITMSALSAIFLSSSIKKLSVCTQCPITDFTPEQKSQLSHSISTNTILKELLLDCVQGDMLAMLDILANSAESITFLHVSCPDLTLEGKHVVAEALAITCTVNMNLRQVGMHYTPPAAVMKSLSTRKEPLEVFVIGRPFRGVKTKIIAQLLNETERTAAEIKVIKVVFDVQYNAELCKAVSAGLGRNPHLREVHLWDVPEEMEESTMTKLSSIMAVKFCCKYHDTWP